MPYVIAEPCIDVKDASCVDVCPVDCIHTSEGAPQYYINPHQCIDCAACESACPVSAIFFDADLPGDWRPFIQVNSDFFSD
ncbi:MAG: ferredoxin family protein [Dehalococcoidia bacterium]|nr:MAG: ferredoxin family protein [bacterium]MCE7927988.1 ferredoxin family protein [Chloroflexi bacterium CFX7]MCK6565722.1 ferredoxin family protein [Dehalococcoidia bacterium]MCL4229984.1 ferredoxin family protein [Dehalococcoidia bacterium]NUQ55549.1 ferredoxin family protein [Dehalococcoidia bacterium]